jgi:parallel beta-helix repeat protein
LKVLRYVIFGDHGGNGIFIQNYSSGNIIKDNIIHDVNGAGVFLAEESHHNLVTNNYIYSCENGVGTNYSNHNEIVSNKTKNNNIGIFMGHGCYNNTVAVNDDSGSIMAGITVEGVEDFLAQYNVVKDNSVKKSSGPAILLRYASENSIKENRIKKCWDGIVLGEFSESNTVERNEVSKSENNGIVVGRYADYNTIKENGVNKSGSCDLFSHPLSGTNNTWENNEYDTSNF